MSEPMKKASRSRCRNGRPRPHRRCVPSGLELHNQTPPVRRIVAVIVMGVLSAISWRGRASQGAWLRRCRRHARDLIRGRAPWRSCSLDRRPQLRFAGALEQRREDMKAVRFDKYGGIDVLKVVDVPVPEAGQAEALVKVKAASINPGEAKIRGGLLHAYWP